jgi:hypothetical protein
MDDVDYDDLVVALKEIVDKYGVITSRAFLAALLKSSNLVVE